MADYSISISNSLNVFGPAPSDLWNERAWNSFLWGEGSNDLQVIVTKYIENLTELSLDSSVSAYAYFNMTLDNSLAPDADMYSESVSDGSGWSYVFPSNVTDGESRFTPTYTEAAAASTTWTSATVATTTWS